MVALPERRVEASIQAWERSGPPAPRAIGARCHRLLAELVDRLFGDELLRPPVGDPAHIDSAPLEVPLQRAYQRARVSPRPET